MKNKIIACIIAFVIALVMAFNVNLNMRERNELSLIALENVEALAEEGSGSTQNLVGYYLKCVDGGTSSATCEIDGELAVGWASVSGSYSKGGTYSYAWARYSCEPTIPYVTSIQCDINDQGIFVNGKKVS